MITNRVLKKIKTREQGLAFGREAIQIQEKTAAGQALTDRLRQIQRDALVLILQPGTPDNMHEQNVARGEYAVASELLQEGFGLIKLMESLGAEIDAEFQQELRALEHAQRNGF